MTHQYISRSKMREANLTEGIARPETIYFHLTRRCNLRCIYCYIAAGETKEAELSTDEIIEILSDVIKLNPKKLVFTGGEPLCRQDIVDLACKFKNIDENNRIWLYMNTNGTLITRDIAPKIVQVFDEIRLSLDGPKDINDALRGEGTFDAVMQAIDYLQEVGGDPTISITINSKNIASLKDFMSFLLRVKWIHNIHLAPFKLSGRGKQYQELLCPQEDAERVVAEFWREHFGFSPRQEARNRPTMNCGVGKYLTVYPDGSVYPCHLLALPEFCVGNVRDKGLFETFSQSELMKKMRGLDFHRIPYCAECFNELSDGAVCLGELYQQVDDVKQGLGELLHLRGKVEG
jgi:radical SAM protein with 4Fe4S-binding SPASM domain